jgi:MHS family proline/betaine transporter-like MFS transporter
MTFKQSVLAKIHFHIKFHLSKLDKESIIAMSGMAIEYYNIFLYGYLAALIIPQFFLRDSPLITLTAVLLSYFIGPLGAIICGHIGDTLGRKRILALALAFVSISSFLISVLPTYDQIGLSASILFLFLRSVQTLGFGGDAVGLVTFILEDAPSKHRGLFGGFMSTGSAAGVLFASLFVTLADPLQDPSSPWKWRFPLCLGAIGMLIAIYVYRTLGETETFKHYKAQHYVKKWPLLDLLKNKKFIFLKCIGLFSLAPIITIVIFGFIPYLGTSELGLSTRYSMWTNTTALLLFAISAPFFGALSDKIGRKWVLCGLSILFFILGLPLFWLLQNKHAYMFFIIQIFFSWIASAYYGVTMTTCIEQLPTRLRYTGVAVSFYLSYALFGGINGLYIVTVLIENAHFDIAPVFYLLLGSIIVFVSAFSLKKEFHGTLERKK